MKIFKSPFFIALSAVLIVLIPIGIYFSHFNHLYLSDKGEDWASFGSFISPFISISSLVLLGYLSFRLYKIEQNRDWTLLTINQLSPFIEIQNIGVGVAKNILVDCKDVSGTNNDRHEVIPLIKAGEKYKLDWGLGQYCNIEIAYHNVHDVKSICYPEAGLDGYIGFSTKEEMIAVFGTWHEKLMFRLNKWLGKKNS